ncbi:hypothetical protein BC830DRAFT_189518 [Chytriomyces sp. MP71]|nr:hypothetical protein BC830DRAFT_189518 [Chytriomyces sp. MP71]
MFLQLDLSNLTPEEEARWEKLVSVPGMIPPNFDIPRVVFVYPEGESPEYWWPALVKRGCNIVRKEDLRILDPKIEPFLSFSKQPGFHDDIAIKRALEFLQVGKPPSKFKWPRWGKAKAMLGITDEPPITLYKIKAITEMERGSIAHDTVILKYGDKAEDFRFGADVLSCTSLQGYEVETGAPAPSEPFSMLISGGESVDSRAFAVDDSIIVHHPELRLWFLGKLLDVNEEECLVKVRYAHWGTK